MFAHPSPADQTSVWSTEMANQIISRPAQTVTDVQVSDAVWRVLPPSPAPTPAPEPQAEPQHDVYIPPWILVMASLAIILAMAALIVAMSASGRNIVFAGVACGAVGVMTGLVLGRIVWR